MVPFEEFRLSHRNSRRHYRRTRWTVLIPVAVILALMGSPALRHTPGLWAALGVVLGVDLILAGAHGLHFTLGRRTRLGARLNDSIDAWFPFLVFIVQNVHLFTVLVVLWFTVQRLGIPISAGQNVVLLSLVVFIPLKRILRELAQARGAPRLETVSDSLTFLIAICITWLVSLGLMAYFSPGYETIEEHSQGPFLFIWVCTLVVVMICAALFIGRLAQAIRGNGT
jgi:hypothetical protein